MPWFIRSFFSKLAYSRKAVEDIFWAACLIVGVYVILWKLISRLDPVQIWGLVVIGIILFLIGCLRFWGWWEERDIEKLPEHLFKLDGIMLDYVDKVTFDKDTPPQMFNDLAKLMKLGTAAVTLETAVKSDDTDRIEKAADEMAKRYQRFLAVKPNDAASLQNMMWELRQIGALLDEHGMGLGELKKGKAYASLYEKIQKLKIRAPTARIGIAVNDYFNSSDGLYAVLLSAKPLMGYPKLRAKLPARVKTGSSLMRPVVENYTHALITAVRESIDSRDTRQTDKRDSKA